MRLATINTTFVKNLQKEYEKTRLLKVFSNWKKDYTILQAENFNEDMVNEIENYGGTVFETIEDFSARKDSKL